MVLTHCGLVASYSCIWTSQHWLRYWVVTLWHQTIDLVNVDFSSVRHNDIHLRATSFSLKLGIEILIYNFVQIYDGPTSLLKYQKVVFQSCLKICSFDAILECVFCSEICLPMCQFVRMAQENLSERFITSVVFPLPWEEIDTSTRHVCSDTASAFYMCNTVVN